MATMVPGNMFPAELEDMFRTCHILPPSEIDLGLCFAVLTSSEGQYLFHRIG